MSIKDAVTKEFIEDKEVFADVFNHWLYGGNPIIRPENLHEMSEEMNSVI